jgi:pimeloyl-ACP methyl ester carboxylesterase
VTRALAIRRAYPYKHGVARPITVVGAVALIVILLAARDTFTRVPTVWAAWNVMAWEVARTLPRDAMPTAAVTVRGTVRGLDARPIVGATAIVPLPDGTTVEGRTRDGGDWEVRGVPVGRRPIWVGAPGMASVVVQIDIADGSSGLGLSVDVTLAPAPPAVTTSDQEWVRQVVSDGPAVALTCERPVVASAMRLEVVAPRAGIGRGQAFRYWPIDGYRPDGGGTAWPAIVVVYPGPAASWECASIPLAAAGFEVVAYGPPYGFDIEGEVARLRILMATLGGRPAVLAGSYSAIHALRLVQDAPLGAIRAVALMGPPVDLFDLRRRLEREGWVPPFGLDRALVALGRPDREVARHARYSARLHVAALHPPTLVIHSQSDEVVPVAQGEAYLQALAEAGVEAEGMILDGGGHYLLSTGGEAEAIRDRTVAFLSRHP